MKTPNKENYLLRAADALDKGLGRASSFVWRFLKSVSPESYTRAVEESLLYCRSVEQGSRYARDLQEETTENVGLRERVAALERIAGSDALAEIQTRLGGQEATIKFLNSQVHRISAAARLQARRDYLHTLAENIGERKVLVLNEKKAVVYQSPEAQGLFGYKNRKWIGDLVYGETSTEIRAAVEDLAELDPRPTFLYVRRNGKRFPVEIKVTPIKTRDLLTGREFHHSTSVEILRSGWRATASKILSKGARCLQRQLVRDAVRHQEGRMEIE